MRYLRWLDWLFYSILALLILKVLSGIQIGSFVYGIAALYLIGGARVAILYSIELPDYYWQMHRVVYTFVFIFISAAVAFFVFKVVN